MKQKSVLRRASILSVVFCLLLSLQARASERILDYRVDARLNSDASLLVCEEISVNIEHQKIRHGITRTYPVKQVYESEKLRHFDFELLEAKLDGKDIPFSRSDYGLMAGLALGYAEHLAPLGEHTYRICYRTHGHVRHLADRDRLYFNAVGQDNAFEVEKASFALTLPEGASPMDFQVYLGKPGEQGQDFEFLEPLQIESTRPLLPGEAMTVLIDWNAGCVAGDPRQLELKNWLGAHREQALGVCCLILLGYFLLLEIRFRRKRYCGIVTPEFSPPADVSPGLCACWQERSFGPLALQADILWAAIKGYLHISLDEDKDLTLKKRSCPAGRDGSASLCATLTNAIFGRAKKRILSRDEDLSDGDKVYGALQRHYGKILAKLQEIDGLGLALTFFGLLLAMLLFWLVEPQIWFENVANSSAFEEVCSNIFLNLFILGAVVFCWLRMVLHARSSHAHPITGRLWAGWFFLWLVLVASLEVVQFVSDWANASLSLLTVLLPAFFFSSRHSIATEAGRELGRHLLGLAMYIRIAEKDRLAKINAPQDSVDRYEEILPYALALGMAKAWQERFAPVLSRAGYAPEWFEHPAALVSHGSEVFDYLACPTSPLAGVSQGASSAALAAASAAKASSYSAGSSSSQGWSSGSSEGSSGGSSGGGSGGGGVGGW